jgi:hypothetical protein
MDITPSISLEVCPGRQICRRCQPIRFLSSTSALRRHLYTIHQVVIPPNKQGRIASIITKHKRKKYLEEYYKTHQEEICANRRKRYKLASK